jgi:hypothetical protein
MGGVRQAAWDSSQPLAGQAMALLALLDAAEALGGGEKVDGGGLPVQ